MSEGEAVALLRSIDERLQRLERLAEEKPRLVSVVVQCPSQEPADVAASVFDALRDDHELVALGRDRSARILAAAVAVVDIPALMVWLEDTPAFEGATWSDEDAAIYGELLRQAE